MSIFREYDIRGIFGEDLNRDVVVAIGAELGREIIARGGKSVGIGYDARKHSPILFEWLCEGISGNSSLGAFFALGGNFGEQQTQKSSFIPKISSKYKTSTANTRIWDLDSATLTQNAESTNICHSERSEESKKNNLVILSDSEESQKKNIRDSSVVSLPQNDNVWLDSANPQNLVENQAKNAESSENNAPLQIYDLGMIPTPCAYYSLYMQNGVDSSIMITGSHNPPKYNGFKITILKKPFYGEDIRKLGERITQNSTNAESSAFAPKVQKLDALNEYINFLTSHFAKLKNFPHKVAFDCGNGVAGIALKSVLKNLNIPHLPLFFEPNGDFPNHHPDPSEDKNLIDLQNAMKEHNIKIGIAFDGDADRIGLLTQNYHFKGDELAILFAKQIAKSGAKPVVIGEVKCSTIMYSEINKFGSAIMHKTGHSNLKVKLAQTNAHLAAEMSGHIFFNDRYFGYDDAIYASLRALELFLDSSVESVEIFIKSLPQMFSTSEEKIDSSEDKKFEIIKKLAKKLNEIRQNQSANQSGGDSQRDSQNATQDFPKIMDIIDIDGIRVVFENGWGLIRASNTTPVLVTRFEGENRECAELYKEKMLSLLSECLGECEGEL